MGLLQELLDLLRVSVGGCHPLWSLLGVVALVVLTSEGVRILSGGDEVQDEVEEAAERLFAVERLSTDIAFPVRVVTVAVGPLVDWVRAEGRIEASRRVAVTARVAGRVEAVPVREGQWVSEGTLLARLEDREFRLAVREAEAVLLKVQAQFLLMTMGGEGEVNRPVGGLISPEELARRKAAYQEVLASLPRGEVTEEEVARRREAYEAGRVLAGEESDRVRAAVSGLTEARLRLERRRLDIEHSRILAPFSGRVANIEVQPGGVVQVGDPVAEVVDARMVKVEVGVLGEKIGQVREGASTQVSVPAYPGEMFSGQVEAVSPVIDPETKTGRVLVRLANPDERLKPGMFAQVRVEGRVHSDRLLVPKEALLVRGGRPLVFVVEGDLAKWRYVKTGLENEEYVEILDGLTAGELVITKGHFTLSHETKVREMESDGR